MIEEIENVALWVDYRLQQQEKKIHSLTEIIKSMKAFAEHAQTLSEKMHKLTLCCLKAKSPLEMMYVFEQELRLLFPADMFFYRVWHPLCAQWPGFCVDLSWIELVKTYREPWCAQIHQWPVDLVNSIPQVQSITVESMAFVPLYSEHGAFGGIFFGSADPEAFSSQSDRFFLIQLSGLLSASIHRFEVS